MDVRQQLEPPGLFRELAMLVGVSVVAADVDLETTLTGEHLAHQISLPPVGSEGEDVQVLEIQRITHTGFQ